MRLHGTAGVLCLFAALLSAAPPPHKTDFGNVALSFEKGSDRFLSRGNGYALSMNAAEAVLKFRNQANGVRMRFAGANPQAQGTGLDALPGRNNYYIGNDPTKWRTNVPTYARVEYRDVYPGVNLVYYGNQRNLEYDLVVAPGADPGKIHLSFDGVAGLELDGDLVLRMKDGELRLRRPVIYQERAGRRQLVRGSYVFEGERQVRFQIEKYDRRRPLYIDPVLSYATYLGGSGDDLAYGIAADSAGNTYIVGTTSSTNFPTVAASQSTSGTGQDVFVTKLTAAGDAILYSTYLGGSGNDYGYGIAIDTAGDAFLTGQTTSTNFPTAGALQGSNLGGADAFVAKLNSTGFLVYSTYLGGSSADSGQAIAIDSSGNAYVAGQTASSNFPTASPKQAAFGGGSTDAFLAKINPGGTALVYSTYLGGIGTDAAFGVAVDSSGNATVAGQTDSTNFPTAVAIQTSLSGPNDAFVTKFNSTGSAFVYSTYLGGSGIDAANGVAVDSSGNAYVTGYTTSANFPTLSPLQAANGGGEDAFVTKLSTTGTLVYSTYLGGAGNDRGNAIFVDTSNNAHIAGNTASSDFPILSPVQGANGGLQDAFLARLNTAGSALVYSTYLGGPGSDGALAVTVDSNGNALIAGFASSGFPTAAALQPAIAGGNFDSFIAKISIPQGACAVNWTGLGGGNLWTTPTNWTGNALPGPSDNVCIGPSVNVVLSAGTQSINSLTVDGTMTLSGTATLSIASASTINSTFTLSGGTLSGAGAVTFTGQLNWSSGTMSGTGSTIISSAAALAISGTVTLTQRVLNNSGTITWTGGDIHFSFSSVLNNQSLFQVQTDNNFIYDCAPCGGVMILNNLSVFRKTAGSGTNNVAAVFNNGGTIDIQSGTLNFTGGGAGSGSVTGAAAGALIFSSGTFTIGAVNGPPVAFNGGTVTMSGALGSNTTIAGGTATVNGIVSSSVWTVSNGTGNINTAGSQINTLNQSGGTVGGTATVQITQFNWSGGIQAGPGTTLIPAGSVLSITGSAVKELNGRIVNNQGTATWSGTGSITTYNSPVFNNQATGTFEIQNDTSITYSCSPCGGALTFNNIGLLRKTGGTGTTAMNSPVTINNTGTLNILSGTISLAAGATGSGTITGAAGGALTLAGGTFNFGDNLSVLTLNITGATANLSGSVTGLSVLNVTGGTVNVNGGGANTVSTVNLSGGVLGGTGTLSVTQFNWTAGVQTGPGITLLAAGASMTISGGGQKDFNGRIVNNSGSVVWTGGIITSYNAPVFNNLGGATFEVQVDANLSYSCSPCGGALTFNNTGTFKKTTTTGTTVFGSTVAFNNSGGLVDIQTGTLSLSGGGTGSGAFQGQTLIFANGTFNLSDTVNVTNASFTGATVTWTGTTFTVSGTATVGSGLANFNGGTATIGTLTINGGTANFSPTSFSPVSTLNLSAGTLGGSTTVNVTSQFSWSGGIMSGPGITSLPAGATMTISGGTQKDLNGRTISNAGTVIWTGGSITSYNAPVFNNLATGIFEAQTDNILSYSCSPCGGALTFNNSGIFRKTTTTGTTTLASPVFFNNAASATVNIQTGTVNFVGGETGSGTITGAAGAAVVFSGGTFTLADSLTVPTVTFSGGNATVSGSYNAATSTTVSGAAVTFTGSVTNLGALTVSGGTANFNTAVAVSVPTANISGGSLGGTATVSVTSQLNWSGGTMVGPGITSIPVGGVLAISGSSQKDLNGRIVNNSGNTTLSGSGTVTSYNAPVFNQLAGTFDIQSDSVVNYSCSPCGGALTINNSGLFRKTGGTGTSTFSNPVAFNNAGTVRAISGTLNFVGGFTQSAGLTSLEGGNLGGTTTIQGGTLTGTGNIAGNVTNSGQFSPGAPVGLINITGNFTQTATGALNVDFGGLTFGSQYDRLAVSGTATLGGAVNVTLVNSFLPIVSNNFLILSFSSRSGSFSAVNAVNAPAGLTFLPAYNATDVTLAAAVPTADLSITQTDLPDPILTTNNVTYSMTVSNAGPSPATGVIVTDSIPNSATLVSVTPSQGSCSGTTIVTCALGAMAIGGSATISLTVHSTAAATLSNTASVAANELDLNVANNVSVEGTTVTSGTTGPVISSLSPANAAGGSAAFTLNVNGSGFVSPVSANWNGVSRVTTFVNANQVRIAVTTADIAQAGSVLISVANTSNGAISNTVTFTVTGNATPAVSSLVPSAATAGLAGMTLVVNGNGFVNGSTVQWNGGNRVTLFVSTTQLQAVLTTADLATAATAQVAVSSPGPGGGVSNSLTFTVLASEGTVGASAAGGAPAATINIPVTLTLGGGFSVDTLSFGLQITPNGAAPPLSGTLTFQQDAAVAVPTLVDATAGPNSIVVSWLPFPAPRSGTVRLGTVAATIPATATVGQSYPVHVTGVSGSLASATVGLLAAADVALAVGGNYLVGDAFPFTGDAVGLFGDSNLDNFDLITALRAVTLIPGAVPLACSDRFDAMDSFPVDGAARGGDGQLNNFDLIQTLRRVVSLDTSRPTRITRGLACPDASPLAKKSPGREAVAGALSLGALQARRNGVVRVPMLLRSDRALLLAGLSIGLGLPDSKQTLRFVAADKHAPTVVDNGLAGMLAVAWLEAFEVGAGETVLLGYVEFDAAEGAARPLQVFGVIANTQDGGDVIVSLPSGDRQR